MLQQPNDVLDEIWDKHEEHLEMMEGDEVPFAIILILSNMVKKERGLTAYYKKLLCKN